MLVREALLSEGTKPVGRKHGSPFLALEPGSIAFERLHDPGQCCDPFHAFVADVPDQPKSTARLENTMDLMNRFRRSEPVKRLRANHRIHRRVSKRYVLG